MTTCIALIGFGEAGQAFAGCLDAHVQVYDSKTDDAAFAAAKQADYEREGVSGFGDAAAALTGAAFALSLVTADQALPAARAGAPFLAKAAFWFDMNSVAPDTKRAAAESISGAGGRYVDVAVMAPVLPARLDVPILAAGAHAEDGAAVLRGIGFTNVTVVPGDIGRASAIKMIRSVMIKGMEALTAECMLAAERAGVLPEVLASLDADQRRGGWAQRADYNLDRMMVHGIRRAAEMEEVVRTLDALGTGSELARGTARRQSAVGLRGLRAPPPGLADKLAVLNAEDAA